MIKDIVMANSVAKELLQETPIENPSHAQSIGPTPGWSHHRRILGQCKGVWALP